MMSFQFLQTLTASPTGERHRRGIRCGQVFCMMLGLLLANSVWAAHTADDHNFPASTQITGLTYQLCSTADMQVYLFIDIGDMALYLPNCAHQPPLDQNKLLAFYYNRDFSRKQLRKSSRELLKRNTTATEYAKLKKPLKAFNHLYKPVSKGDVYQLGINADGQLALYLNGHFLGASKSNALSQVYFRIWLGDDPMRKSIKADLLDLH